MLIPKKRKYKKSQKGKFPIGISTKGNKLNFGNYGIVSLQNGLLKTNQIESVRKAIMRKTKRGAKLWIRINTDIPVTKKPIEIRMGKGKGAVDHWIRKVKKGTVLFELFHQDQMLIKEAFDYSKYKLPIKVELRKNMYSV